jgi:Flp pilus assembly protein TadG
MRHRPSRYPRRAGRGQALVEFAFVLPIFLLILFGIIDGGRAIYSNNALSQAAREGARWGSVQERAQDTAGRRAIEAETLARITAVGSTTATVTCERNGSTIATCGSGDILVVTVEADFQFVTPFLGSLMGEPTLVAESKVMVNQ